MNTPSIPVVVVPQGFNPCDSAQVRHLLDTYHATMKAERPDIVCETNVAGQVMEAVARACKPSPFALSCMVHDMILWSMFDYKH